MSLFDDLSAKLAPHTRHLSDTIAYHGSRITQSLEEFRAQSDVGRGDTGDMYEHQIVRNAALPAASNVMEGPTQGEIWMLQYLVSNGKGAKTPAFAIRTTTGRLVAVAEAEQNLNLSFSGNVVIMPGEELVIESAAGGAFDLLLEVILRKFPRMLPDAGYGVSEEVFEERARGEHEVDRDALAALGQQGSHIPTV